MSRPTLRAKRATYVYIFSGQFLKPEAYGQTVLPEKSILTGQKLVENAKIEKVKCNILGNFQTQ